MIIKLLIDGGDMKPGPVVGQKLGPLGININQIIQKVNESTKGFKGMKVPVELDINPTSKKFEVSVSSPPVAELLKKELKIDKGSNARKKLKVGNLAIEQIISIAKIKHPNMIVSSFKAAVKSVVGSCVSLGIIVENKDPKEVEQEIEEGKYDSEINEQRTEIPPEKKQKLDEFYGEIKSKQDLILKKEADEKAAEEEKKAEAAKAEPPKPEEVPSKK